ncbi:cullin-associated NEDD8-dissociated protein 1 [Pseudoscourfieldia marina]
MPSSGSVNNNVSFMSILDSFSNSDKDIRYMGASDLLALLENRGAAHYADNNNISGGRSSAANVSSGGGRSSAPSSAQAGGGAQLLDADTERRLTRAVLDQLDDPSGDVSNLVVRCLGPLALVMHAQRVEELAKGLCDKLLSSSADTTRENGALGLKSVVSDIGAATNAGAAATAVVQAAAPRLFASLATDAGTDERTRTDALDILGACARHFGRALATAHADSACDVLLPIAGGGKSVAARKRAAACLAAMCANLAPDNLERACQSVCESLSKTATAKPGYASALAALCRGASTASTSSASATTGASADTFEANPSLAHARRVGASLAPAARVLPALVIKLREDASSEELEEMVTAIECYIACCPRDAASSGVLEEALSCASKMLRYDPNYTGYGDEDDDDDVEDMDGDGDGDDDDYGSDDDDAYSDDDDGSWKVRRAAARVCRAAAAAGPAAAFGALEACGRSLRRAFDDRDEGVRVDAMSAHAALMPQAARADEASADRLAVTTLVTRLVKQAIGDPKARGGGMVRAREAAFRSLGEVVAVLPPLSPSIGLAPGEVAEVLGAAVASIGTFAAASLAATASSSVGQQSATLILCVIGVVRSLLSELLSAALSTDPSRAAAAASLVRSDGAVKQHIASLADHLAALSRDRYYKVASAALHALRSLALCMNAEVTLPGSPQGGELDAELAGKVAPSLASAGLSRLVDGADVDVEVKLAAVDVIVATLVRLGPSALAASGDAETSADALYACLLDKVQNAESVRLAALRGICSLLASRNGVAIVLADPARLPSLVGTLAEFLKKANRRISVAAIIGIERCVQLAPVSALSALAGGAEAPAVSACREASKACLGEVDMQLTRRALQMQTRVLSRTCELAASGDTKAAGAAAAGVASAAEPELRRLLAGSALPGDASAMEAIASFYGALAAAELSCAGSKAKACAKELLTRCDGLLSAASGSGAAGMSSGDASPAPASASGDSIMIDARGAAAACAARCASACGAAELAEHVAKAAKHAQSTAAGGAGASSGSGIVQVLLLGYLGSHVDLARLCGGKGADTAPWSALMACVADGGDEVRRCAAKCLGMIAAGSPEALLSALLGAIDAVWQEAEAESSAPVSSASGGGAKVTTISAAARTAGLLVGALRDVARLVRWGDVQAAAPLNPRVRVNGLGLTLTLTQSNLLQDAAAVALAPSAPSKALRERFVESLVKYCASSDEARRATAADALGVHALRSPSDGLPALARLAADGNDARARGGGAIALRHFAFATSPTAVAGVVRDADDAWSRASRAASGPLPSEECLLLVVAAADMSGSAAPAPLGTAEAPSHLLVSAEDVAKALAPTPALLGDSASHEVRRAAALLFDACVRVHLKKSSSLASSASAHVGDGAPPTVLPLAWFDACQRPLVALLTPLPELVTVVDLGPFKHRVDAGVEMRRAAYDALLAICDCRRVGANMLAWEELLTVLAQGVAEEAPEVKLSAHALIVKLCGLVRACWCHGNDAPREAALKAMESYAPGLTKTLTARLRSEAVKQEVDRHEEMIGSCLKAIAALSRVASNGGDFSAEAGRLPAFAKVLSICETTHAVRYALEQQQDHAHQ